MGVLAGDIFQPGKNRLKLAVFFALVKLQKWPGLVAPRMAWDTLPSAAKL